MTSPLNNLITREDITTLAHSEQLSFDDEERISILETMSSIDVQACPGSGKTTLIAAKLILLAKKWPLSGQGICVLSHTNVAKDEIIERLKKSKTLEAQRLLSYPHFIGTIQEYVGKYIAFPYLRSKNIDINCVDTDVCVDLIYSKISRTARFRIDGGSKHSNVLYGFDIGYSGGKLSMNVPTFKATSNSDSYKNLQKVRMELIKQGFFFYKDIFTFGQMALSQSPMVSEFLRKRFPLVLIDEMQDTQKFQDELLCKVFPLDDPRVIVQRFGDPDQAIFHGTKNDEPNDSFNEKLAVDMNYVVHKSHRFDFGIASKIKPLSRNAIPLETELTQEALLRRSQAHITGNSFEHGVIIFDDNTRDDVIQSFGDMVSKQFHEEYKSSDKFIVKALGAVGNEIDPTVEQLKIGHYWAGYDKSKAKNSFKENSLIEVVRHCRDSSSFDLSGVYKLLLTSILKLLYLAGVNDDSGRRYTSTSLRNFLEVANHWQYFRETLYVLLIDEKPLSRDLWVTFSNSLTLILDLQSIPENVKHYLAYSEEALIIGDQNESLKEVKGSLIPLPENVVRHQDGFNIQLSTIHGVKGETHDATLVMETRNRSYDIQVLLDHIAAIDKGRITKSQKTKFARQLYVAASRPRHLLCFAIHKDRIEETQKAALSALGWNLLFLENSATDDQ